MFILLCKVVDAYNNMLGYKLKTSESPDIESVTISKDKLRESIEKHLIYYYPFGATHPIRVVAFDDIDQLNIPVYIDWGIDDTSHIEQAQKAQLKSNAIGKNTFEYKIYTGNRVQLTKVHSNNALDKFVIYPFFDFALPGAFSYCNIQEIVVKNRPDVWFNADGLCKLMESKRLKVSFDHPEKVVSASEMFNLCWHLEELDLSNFTGENVTDMTRMFSSCENLKHLDISHLVTSKVKSMHQMFKGCGTLSKLDFSNFDTRSLEECSYMFDGCKHIRELDLSSFDMGNVENATAMFNECMTLRKLDISQFDFPEKAELNSMFRLCMELSEVKLGKISLTPKNIYLYLDYLDSNTSRLSKSYLRVVENLGNNWNSAKTGWF